MRDDAVRVGKRFLGDFQRDDIGGLAAELAYRFLFAIFPFGIFVAALTAFVAGALGFSDPTGQIMGSLGDNLPADLASGVRTQLETVIGATRPGLLTVGAVTSLWAATGGTNALIKAMNRAWEVEETRPLIPRYALAIGLTLLASVGLIVSFVTIVGASLLTTEIVTRLALDHDVVDAISFARWPAVFALLSVAVGILYHWAPNFRAPWRWCIAGGALFSVAWLVATGVFALYVANFANYANTYGALGGVIVLMLWLYISALILVAAAALVAATLKELHPMTVHEQRVQRGATTGRPIDIRPVEVKRAPTPTPAPTLAPSPPGPAMLALAQGRRAATRRRRRSAPRTYRMSPPEDWALAGIVAAVGAALGVAAAWIASPRQRG